MEYIYLQPDIVTKIILTCLFYRKHISFKVLEEKPVKKTIFYELTAENPAFVYPIYKIYLLFFLNIKKKTIFVTIDG